MIELQFIKFLGESLSNEYVYVEAVELDDFIRLEYIKVKEKYRGQGYGTKVLEKLISYADEKNKILVLKAEPLVRKFPTQRLKDFYRRFGFVDNRGKNNLGRFWNDNMYRLPKNHQQPA